MITSIIMTIMVFIVPVFMIFFFLPPESKGGIFLDKLVEYCKSLTHKEK